MDNGSRPKKKIDWRGIGEKTVDKGKQVIEIADEVVDFLRKILIITSKNK